MGGWDTVNVNKLRCSDATGGQEIPGATDNGQVADRERLVFLSKDGDGTLVFAGRNGGGEDVQERIVVLRIEDPNTLGNSDLG